VACGWMQSMDSMNKLRDELTSAQADMDRCTVQLQSMCEVRGVRLAGMLLSAIL
jgi:hypothetical protein